MAKGIQVQRLQWQREIDIDSPSYIKTDWFQGWLRLPDILEHHATMEDKNGMSMYSNSESSPDDSLRRSAVERHASWIGNYPSLGRHGMHAFPVREQIRLPFLANPLHHLEHLHQLLISIFIHYEFFKMGDLGIQDLFKHLENHEAG